MARLYHRDFSDFKDVVWLNAASEGPLPKVSACALTEAIRWKSTPHLLTLDKFINVPNQLKSSIGALIHAPASEVILANSASYGLHLLADGLPLGAGDEVLLMANDFPSNILPWLALKEKGVRVVQIKARDRILTAKEFEEHITKRTRVFCVSHVHTFTGLVFDISGLQKLCSLHNIIFILNISQSVGTRSIDLRQLKADAVVAAGYKWLCGPYGTGFCWIKPEVRSQMVLNRAYWASVLNKAHLLSEDALVLRQDNTARKYDVFATANFFNFVPFNASIEYFLEIGIDAAQDYQQDLVQLIVDGLDLNKYRFISDTARHSRSALCVISCQNPNLNESIHQLLLDKKIFTAFWKGNIRISPHIYNVREDISRVLEILNSIEL